MRPIMTAAELAEYKVDEHGRDYRRSDDGYSDMEVAAEAGWSAISGWGSDGWDLGDWPFVVISVRNVDGEECVVGPARGQVFGCYEMRQTCEGDTTVYRFDSQDDRNAAIDFLFIWYGMSRGYEEWEVEGLGSRWNEETSRYEGREALDAGALRVPERFRGPYSSQRVST